VVAIQSLAAGAGGAALAVDRPQLELFCTELTGIDTWVYSGFIHKCL
jgi:hypothetical protein